MCEPMPHGDFRWLTEQEIKALNVTNMTSNQDQGYFFEVDIEVPPAVHREQNSYPLAPEHLVITQDMLSPYALSCHKAFNGDRDYKAKKLCGTFLPKKNYCVHYMNLKVSNVKRLGYFS